MSLTEGLSVIQSTNSMSLVPSRLHYGLGGFIKMSSQCERNRSHLTEVNGTKNWRNSWSDIAIRGKGDWTTSPAGWEVYVVGESKCASHVAGVLDEINLQGSVGHDPLLSDEAKRRLYWGLLPVSAVAAIHLPTGTACLLRDPCGFCCLYYTLRESGLYFSSCLAALHEGAPPAGINTDKISEMLVFGHRGGNRSIWQNINVVGPGSVVFFLPQARPRIESLSRVPCFFDIDERHRLERQSVDKTLAELGEAVRESLAPIDKNPRIAVPCGGGVDSSLLGAFLARQGHQVTFWTLNQPEATRRESDWIEPLSQSLGIRCELVNLNRQGFLKLLIDILQRTHHPAMGPNAVGGLLVQRAALEKGEQTFVSGEMCDTLFGGLSAFNYLSPRFRLLQFLSRLPSRWRFWLRRGLSGWMSCIHEISQVVHGRQAALVGAGALERGYLNCELESFTYPGQSTAQRMADMLTFSELKLVPETLHHDFHERGEDLGGTMSYPFAHPRMIKLGIHLPYKLKRRNGHNKWIWRQFASSYIGREAAFRRKYSFPTLSERWLDRAAELLKNGFLEDLFCSPVDQVFQRLPTGDTARWTMVNLELWGRLNIWHETPDSLLNRLL